MRTFSLSWATTLFLALQAAADNAHIYLSSRASTDEAATLTPSEASYLILQRLGASHLLSLKDASEYTINAINTYGAEVQDVFSGRRPTTSRALIVIEAMDVAELEQEGARHLLLSHTPSAQVNGDFLIKLKSVVSNTIETAQYAPLSRLTTWVDSALAGNSPAAYVQHIRELEYVADKDGPSSSKYRHTSAAIKAQLARLMKASPNGVEYTIITIPLEAQPNGVFDFFKSKFGSSWNAHAMKKRQVDGADLEGGSAWDDVYGTMDGIGDKLQTVDTPSTDRPETEWLPHDSLRDHQEDADEPAPAAVLDETVNVQQSQPDFNPPKGVLPYCFASNATCNEHTNSCSGRGSCVRKYTTNDYSCFACSCKSTQNDDGRTTAWAGPACQKKDVSTPFWLLTSTVIGLAGAVFTGVGMLYSMGSQELPSVIGAGVAGPKPK